jgi:hypothetical protein
MAALVSMLHSESSLMRPLRSLAATLATVVCCVVVAPAHSSAGTNFSDQWWNPDEDGWGASVLHQHDTLFIDLFVYANTADRRPVWYTAAARFQPQSDRTLFSGLLYATTGPWFGGFFNPLEVHRTPVGTLTFEATSTDTATLSYSVNGLLVVKSVQRQFWTYEDFTGSYYGGLVYDQSACANSSDNGRVEELGPFRIDHTTTTLLTLTLQSTAGNCTVAGNYSQLGHMGRVDASYSCTYGIAGTMTLYELERTSAGMTGRFVASNNACDVEGTLGGVER